MNIYLDIMNKGDKTMDRQEVIPPDFKKDQHD